MARETSTISHNASPSIGKVLEAEATDLANERFTEPISRQTFMNEVEHAESSLVSNKDHSAGHEASHAPDDTPQMSRPTIQRVTMPQIFQPVDLQPSMKKFQNGQS